MDDFTVPYGQLTFDAEGDENKYFSRRLHLPPGSGVTIGRGYDMLFKDIKKIYKDLTSVGIEQAPHFAMGSRLKGNEAKKFISDVEHLLAVMERSSIITPAQQKDLFLLSYKEAEDDVFRICRKSDVVKVYGATNWFTLNPKIKDVLIDLRFRGDYTPKTRKLVQPWVALNDIKMFKRGVALIDSPEYRKDMRLKALT